MTTAIIKVEPTAIVPLKHLAVQIKEEHRRYENAARTAMDHAVRVGITASNNHQGVRRNDNAHTGRDRAGVVISMEIQL